MSEVTVSIICNAYNHESYIRDALDGFVMQKTNFAFEILIHDDASTDKTADIIREYEAKYPNLIKPIYQTENQYSKGIGAPRIYQESRVKGKYIAFCEGDDYWTDPLKLQRQYDALEAHPGVDICAHAAIAVEADTGNALRYISPENHETILSASDVINGGGGYVATASLMYRAALNDNPPSFRQLMRLDYTLQIHGSLRGGMIYLPDCMCVYRVMSKGSWTSRMAADKSKREKHEEKVQNMLEILNENTDGKYDDIIKKMILKSQFYVFLLNENYKAAVSKRFALILKDLPVKERLKLCLKAAFPFLISIKRKLVK